MMFTEPPVKSSTNGQTHNHRHLSVESLLGALSFEQLSPFYKRKKLTPSSSSASTHNSDDQDNHNDGIHSLPTPPDLSSTGSSSSTSPRGKKTTTRSKLRSAAAAAAPSFLSPALARRGKARTKLHKKKKNHDEQVHAAVNRIILYGTLDPDGNVEVYYDAAEFGDGSHHNEFAPHSSRESVLVRHDSGRVPVNVVEVRGGGGGVDETIQVSEGLSSSFSTSFELSNEPTPQQAQVQPPPPPPPPPPQQLPLRFLRAAKGDPVQGLKRYEDTLRWRKENDIDTLLRAPSPHYALIHEHYKSYIHLRGRNNEPVYYEQPPRTNLKAMAKGGVTVESLLRHYAAVTEFQWQMVERDDLARSITVIDLQGMKMTDFVGDVVDFSKRASQFCGAHYPERAGYVLVVNVPSWFSWIWNVVKPWLDPVTLDKIQMIRIGATDELRRAMLERIPQENLPVEYGGTCTIPLGQSPEQEQWAALMRHNNELAQAKAEAAKAAGDNAAASPPPCGGVAGNCPFCSWVPARSY